MTKDEYESCNVTGKNNTGHDGPYTWTAPSSARQEPFYFACGLGKDPSTGIGSHCDPKVGNMRASITVKNSCKNQQPVCTIAWKYDENNPIPDKCVTPGFLSLFRLSNY